MSSGPNRRFALTLHYDGTDFHGWQSQPDLRTIQGEIETVLVKITGARRPVTGSGRTDAGVHARGQVASVDLPARWDPESLRSALNALLPRDIRVAEASRVSAGFHPRYDAVARSYEYRIGFGEEAFSPFHRPFCWALPDELDRDRLDAAAALIPGERSFRSFAKAGQPHRGERCAVRAAGWSGWEELGVAFAVTADRYLHRMVRYLVGTMVDVACGRRPLEEMGTLLEDPGGDLTTSPPAPPEGLYLTRVEYPREKLFDDDLDPLSRTRP